jgi:hypothetical protein
MRVMRQRFATLFVAVVVGGAHACSTSANPVVAPDASASANDSGGVVNDVAATSSGGDAVQPIVDAGGHGDAAQPIVDASGDGDAAAVEVDASADCVKYCVCMAMNCTDKVFPSGCLYECATQTTWDLACRTNMCLLVPAQPNNDHCTHAFGENQCLNE